MTYLFLLLLLKLSNVDFWHFDFRESESFEVLFIMARGEFVSYEFLKENRNHCSRIV
jgi:hypothetical protein